MSGHSSEARTLAPTSPQTPTLTPPPDGRILSPQIERRESRDAQNSLHPLPPRLCLHSPPNRPRRHPHRNPYRRRPHLRLHPPIPLRLSRPASPRRPSPPPHPWLHRPHPRPHPPPPLF